jgi:RNA polymerase sigma-70 factor (ECF subfamily)
VPAENLQTQFEQLLQPVIGPAYGNAARLCRRPDDAEDLVQEAALQAFRAFHTFAPGTNFRAWFLKILTNLFFQRYRKQQREPEIVDLEDAPDLYLFRGDLGCDPLTG